uniref:DUF3795 domain-containing protein n=1 Tax=candidate division WOR-3 bacterium TaxID=2052148 RepID=A0A7C1SDV5_UNCW3
MAEKMIAWCGIDCAQCPAFIGTRTGNQELLTETARKWSTPEWQLKPGDLICDGCVAGGRLVKFCYECPTRECGQKRGVKNCGWCDDYPCAALEQHWARFSLPDQRRNLDEEKRRKESGAQG